MEETEIDLRPFLRAILRGWWLIAICAVAMASIAGIRYIQRDPTYVSQAEVVIVRLQSEVDFESNIKAAEPVATDPNTLRSGLVTIASSAPVAREVIKALGDSLPVSLRDPSALRGLVTADADGNTNVIRLTVHAGDQKLSETIVNAWAEAFVKLANVAFAAETRATDLSDELEQARKDLENHQRRLADSELAGEVARLENQAEETETLIETLRSSYMSIISSTLTAEADERAELLNGYGSAYWIDQNVPLSAERQSKIDELSSLYTLAARLRLLRDEVRAFRDQVERGSTGGNSVPYTLLKAQLFAGSTPLSTTVQLQITPNDNDVPTVADLDALLATTDERLKLIDAQVAELAAAFRSGTAYTLPAPATPNAARDALGKQLDEGQGQFNVLNLLDGLVVTGTGALVSHPGVAEYEDKYQELLAELERKQGQLFILAQERDIARANYTALSTRVRELQAATAVDDPVVRLVGEGAFVGVGKQGSTAIGLAFGAGALLATLFLILRTIVQGILAESNVPVVRPKAGISGD